MVRMNWSWEKNRWAHVPERRCATAGCRFQAVPGKVWCIRHPALTAQESERILAICSRSSGAISLALSLTVNTVPREAGD